MWDLKTFSELIEKIDEIKKYIKILNDKLSTIPNNDNNDRDHIEATKEMLAIHEKDLKELYNYWIPPQGIDDFKKLNNRIQELQTSKKKLINSIQETDEQLKEIENKLDKLLDRRQNFLKQPKEKNVKIELYSFVLGDTPNNKTNFQSNRLENKCSILNKFSTFSPSPIKTSSGALIKKIFEIFNQIAILIIPLTLHPFSLLILQQEALKNQNTETTRTIKKR